jgi:hypothetical protein
VSEEDNAMMIVYPKVLALLKAAFMLVLGVVVPARCET